MARQVISTFTDDIDGSVASETVTFGYRGRNYEIDLSETHARQLEEFLSPYLEHGRRVRQRRGRGDGGGQRRSELDTAAIRQWAKQQGLAVPARGRIPADIVRRYMTTLGQSDRQGSGTRDQGQPMSA
jgi:hypothetical protein